MFPSHKIKAVARRRQRLPMSDANANDIESLPTPAESIELRRLEIVFAKESHQTLALFAVEGRPCTSEENDTDRLVQFGQRMQEERER